MKLFIYGGSFDPFHIGHELIVNNVLSLCDKLIIVPTNQSPHKSHRPAFNSKSRYNMLQLMFENNNKIDVSNYELTKANPAFTYDTILHLKSKYKKPNITIVIGYDLIKGLSSWYRINEIKEEVKFLAYHRNEYNKNQFKDFDISYVEDFNQSVASSKVRDLLENKKFGTVKPMLPSLIYDYITNKESYQC